MAFAAAAVAAIASHGTPAGARPDADAERLAEIRKLVEGGREALRANARTARSTLREALAKGRLPEVRALAARGLLRMDGAAAAEWVLEAMATERDPSAERGLAEAWGEVPGREGARVLLAAADDRRDERRGALCAEALGALPGGVGADDLLAVVGGPCPWPVAAGACLGLGRIREIRAVEALLARLRHADSAVRSAARESLVTLCAVDHGTDPAAWERWWAAAREGFAFPTAAPPEAPPPENRGKTSDKQRDGRATFARFFGIELRGPRIAFVIDYSQSMWGPRRERAERELVEAVKGLPSTATFAVVLFNERVWWFRPGPLPARPQEKLDLVRFLPGEETKSYTNIHDAVEEALGLLGVGAEARDPAPGLDEIVLLSDGVPNRGKVRGEDRIIEALTTLNAGRARIHTVSLGDTPTTLLRRLAEANGGRHVVEPIAK